MNNNIARHYNNIIFSDEEKKILKFIKKLRYLFLLYRFFDAYNGVMCVNVMNDTEKCVHEINVF